MTAYEELRSIELFWLDGDVFFACSVLFPVLFDPSFEAFAGGGVASGEGQGGDVAVGDSQLGALGGRDDADGGVGEGFAAAAIEDVAVDLAAIFQREGHVAAVVEG